MFSNKPAARYGALLVWLVVLHAAVAFGQVVTGAIQGRVTDTTGAVVPGTTVQIQNADTGFSQNAQSDSQGRYLSRNLPLGSYTVTVQQSGFQTQVRRGIVLTVGSEVTVNMELAVGNVQEKVEVTAEAPAIETTSSTLSGLVSQDQLRDLPLNGRNIDSLALLSPGVLANRTSTRNLAVGAGFHLSVNGARPDSMLYLLDGTVVNDHSNNGRGSAAGQSLGVEGILEFRLLTHSFSAEYGRNAGGVVSAVTRSGTNEFHGSVFEFVRNNIFDARNFFNPGDLPAFRRNQFGAAAGGPVIKDRIFFFANYEGLRQRQGNTIIVSTPDLNARRGLVPATAGRCTTGTLTAEGLCQVPLNPAVVPYLNLYPLPNTSLNFGDGTARYITDFSAPDTDDYAMERMDFRLSDKDSFYWRYVYDPSEATKSRPVPPFATTVRGTDHFVVLSETHIFSGSSLNEFRFAFNRTAPTQTANTPVDPSLSIAPGQPFGSFLYSAAATSGGANQLTELGGDRNAAGRYFLNLFQETDTYSTVRGAHSLKFGVDVERQQLQTVNASDIRGQFQFSGLLPLLAGTPTQYRFLLVDSTSNNRRGYRRILFGAFAQDDFRVRPNLTLNLGLRYEFFNAPSEVNGLVSDQRNLTDPKNTPGPPFVTSKANFAPRVGLAWDPSGSGKTSVRVGAGIFYNHVDGRTWYNNAGTNSDFVKAYQIANPLFPNALAGGLNVQLQTNNSSQFEMDTPTIIHYNLEVQRQLTSTLNLRVGYVGSQGYNLTRFAEANIRIPTIQADGSKFFCSAVSVAIGCPAISPVVNSNFSSMGRLTTDTTSNYNGLQAVLQKTVSAGLRLAASYTYSKAHSEADQITTGQENSTAVTVLDPSDLRRDYSLSAYDQRQTLVLNGQYQMPWDKGLNNRIAKAALGGWAINGIFSYGSGLPFDLGAGFNNSRNADTNQPDRPDLLPGFSNNPIHGVTAGCAGIPAGQKLRTPERWYDPCAFELSPAGTYGNLGRNTVTMPGLKNVDITLVKSTPLSERKSLEFRAEFFNLFNHANFGLPVRSVFNSTRARSGNAGSITTTSTENRQIQLGLKLMF